MLENFLLQPDLILKKLYKLCRLFYIVYFSKYEACFTKLLSHHEKTPSSMIVGAEFMLDVGRRLIKGGILVQVVSRDGLPTRLEVEQRQLQESNKWLAGDSKLLLRLCDDRALM